MYPTTESRKSHNSAGRWWMFLPWPFLNIPGKISGDNWVFIHALSTHFSNVCHNKNTNASRRQEFYRRWTVSLELSACRITWQRYLTFYSLRDFWRHFGLCRAAAHSDCCFFAPCRNILTYLLTDSVKQYKYARRDANNIILQYRWNKTM